MAETNTAGTRPDVREGWTVVITDHDYLNDSRDNVTVTDVREDGATLRPRRPWSSQGRRFPTMNITWTRLEWSGNTARLYTMPTGITSRSTPGVRRLIKTFAFAPPRA